MCDLGGLRDGSISRGDAPIIPATGAPRPHEHHTVAVVGIQVVVGSVNVVGDHLGHRGRDRLPPGDSGDHRGDGGARVTDGTLRTSNISVMPGRNKRTS